MDKKKICSEMDQWNKTKKLSFDFETDFREIDGENHLVTIIKKFASELHVFVPSTENEKVLIHLLVEKEKKLDKINGIMMNFRDLLDRR